MPLILVEDVHAENHIPVCQTLELPTGETLVVITCPTCGRVTAHLPGQRFYILAPGNFWASHKPKTAPSMSRSKL